VSEPYLLPAAPIETLDDYLAAGGGEGLERARQLGPAQTVKELSLSGLRGRGGGGFPTGRKWSTILRATGTHNYVVANGAEGEPATFKDRALMRANPYAVVEGIAIATRTVGAREAFIALKGSFATERDRMTRALEEMQDAGLLGDIPVTMVAGPDEYLFGEEKALLEVIEGREPLPRLFPPYEHGLFATAPQSGWEAHEPESGHTGVHQSNPTLVNNVETLANVTHVLARGAEWFRSMGTDESPGHVIVTVVGDVHRAGVREVELGATLRSVIEEIGGGPRAGRRVKAVISGIANAVVTAPDQLDTPVSYEGMQRAGTGLGAAGFAVFDDETCMVEVARAYSRFLYVESCNQCPACKLGSGAITELLERIEGTAATDRDVATIGARLKTVTDGNRCYLPVQEQAVVSSLLRSFPEEFAEHLEGRPCPRPGRVAVPKIVDIVDGTMVYDERQSRKQPDWTYSS
jgi:NADH:ubiquinone oxidoreductase subunit F (NADH-binding)